MRKILRLTFAAALALVSSFSFAQTTVTFTAGTDTGEQTNAGVAGDKVTKDGITIETTEGNSAFAAAQYRFAKGSTTTFSSTVGNITKVEFTCTADDDAKYGPGCFTAPSAGTYNYSGKTGTWTGDAASFTLTASSNQVRATKIEVTYTPNGTTPTEKLAAPVITGKTPFVGSTLVTITADEGADIYYTTNRQDPATDQEAIKYTEPFEITTSCLVRAVAIKGDLTSDGASKEFELASEVSKTLPYSDLSESQGDFTVDDKVIDPAGLETVWKWNSSKYMKGTGYVKKTEIYTTESWLVSPNIDLATAKKPVVSFQHTGKYFGDVTKEATLWIKEKGATDWTQLTIPAYFTGSDWKFVSDSIDISAYAGKTVQIAFKYTSDTSNQGTWEVKNFSVTDEGATTPTGDKGTLENPYTPAEANALGQTTDEVYVKGIVSQDPTINTKYNDVNYYISADGSETDQFYIYNGKGLNGADVTSETDIVKGDTVIVKGKVTTYNGTVEFARGSQIVYLGHGSVNPPTPTEDPVVADIAAFKALDNNTDAVLTLNNAQVLYTWTSNNNHNSTYVRDASGALLLYDAGLDLTANQILNGTVNLNRNEFNNQIQAKSNSKTNKDNLTITAGEAAQPKAITPAEASANVSDLVQLSGVNIVANGTRFYAVSGTDSLQVYNGFHLDGYEVAEAQNVNIKGIITLYKSTYEIQPVEAPTVATGINEIKGEANALDVNAPLYNLAGQRVNKSYKGVVIQNGRKFLLK